MEIQTVPTWLNQQFVDKVLQQKQNNHRIMSTHYEVKTVSESENNLGLLYRIKFFYNKNSTNQIKVEESYEYFIVKAPPTGKEILDFMNQIGAIQTELYIYKSVLPAMYRVMDEAMSGEIANQHRLTTDFYECPQADVLVLEDLKHKGYDMKDRCRLLDFEHSSAALKALARFHASSIAICMKTPDIFRNMGEKQFTADPERLIAEKGFTAMRIRQLISELEKYPEHTKYVAKLQTAIEDIVEKVVQVVKPIKDSISVLNHGDYWVNNILFHYSSESGIIDSVKFIDFQFCRVSSPVLDLHYFMYTSVRPEVLLEQTSDLLEVYHSEFDRTKKALNCGAEYTLQQLKKEFYEKEYFGFFNACTKLYVVLQGPSHSSGKSSTKQTGTKQCGEVVLLKDIFRILWPYFENKGYI